MFLNFIGVDFYFPLCFWSLEMGDLFCHVYPRVFFFILLMQSFIFHFIFGHLKWETCSVMYTQKIFHLINAFFLCFIMQVIFFASNIKICGESQHLLHSELSLTNIAVSRST